MLRKNLFKYDYKSLNEDLLKNNIKIFLINNCRNIKLKNLAKLFLLNDYCCDYEIHTGKHALLICNFKNSYLSRSYSNSSLKEITYKEYLELLPKSHVLLAISNKATLRNVSSLCQAIAEKHKLNI